MASGNVIRRFPSRSQLRKTRRQLYVHFAGIQLARFCKCHRAAAPGSRRSASRIHRCGRRNAPPPPGCKRPGFTAGKVSPKKRIGFRIRPAAVRLKCASAGSARQPSGTFNDNRAFRGSLGMPRSREREGGAAVDRQNVRPRDRPAPRSPA